MIIIIFVFQTGPYIIQRHKQMKMQLPCCNTTDHLKAGFLLYFIFFYTTKFEEVEGGTLVRPRPSVQLFVCPLRLSLVVKLENCLS